MTSRYAPACSRPGPRSSASHATSYLVPGSDGGPIRRVHAGARLLSSGMRAVVESMTTHCQVTGRFAGELRFGPGVINPLQHTFARWDGRGVPRGLSGDAIAIAARVFSVANYVEVEHQRAGLDAALELARRFAGSILDPHLVEALADDAPEIFAELDRPSWEAVLAAEPGVRGRLVGDQFETVLSALGDFADLKSPWFSGHSGRVAELAATAAGVLALPPDDVVRLRRAALVHSIGRSGVSNTIWDKPGQLTIAERERMQLYAYYTDRILRRGSLADLADLASASHERLDGSGFPRGLDRSALSPAARVLAAADVYDALTSPRPHRAPMTADQAAEELTRESRAGRLDGDAVEAVRRAVGRARTTRPTSRPRRADPTRGGGAPPHRHRTHDSAGRGRSDHLAQDRRSPHPAHLRKIGASNRSVATMFAMRNGLV